MLKASTCFLVFVVIATFASLGCISRPAEAAQIDPATDAPRPHSPEESRALFRVSQGFHVELVAAEPALADPVAMAFDPRGRIFVCEIHGYNLEGHLDVLELNKTGVLDKAVRRIPATEDAMKRALEGQYGTVKLLEDSDGDGRTDRWSVWADRLPPCYGVVPARGGVIVLCAPDIIFLADRDGDREAEVRQTLFTGFGVDEMWSRINNPRWGPDNWIYAAGALGSGGTISGPNLDKEVRLGPTGFRFKPDGRAIEPCSGTSSGFGLAIDDWGDRFLVTNQQHALFVAPLGRRYLARNPFYSAPNPVTNISSYGRPARVYPASRPHPWRQARSEDPRWVKFYGAAEATANGYFTAASGQTIYQARAFPKQYWGNHFSVDPAQNMIHRCLLDRDGTGYVARRAPGEETVEFLTSTEQWFRPANLTTGPDGALYVVDMYREIIEDYSAIPRYLQQQYGLTMGADRGRIWRIVADAAQRPRKFDLATAPSEQLVRELAHTNAWRRRTAQRLLVARHDRSVSGLLFSLAAGEGAPQTRLHALYALDGLESLDPPTVEGALGDGHFALRMHALRLAEKWLPEHTGVTESVFRLVDDPDSRVRLQLALTVGQSRDHRRIAVLAKLATRDGDEPWMRAAILSSSADSSGRLLRAIRDSQGDGPKSRALVHPLASVVGARRNDEEMGSLLEMIEAADRELADRELADRELADRELADRKDSAEFRLLSLKGLIEGLGRGERRTLLSASGRRAIGSLLIDSSAEVPQLALRVAGLLRLAGAPEIKAAYARAAQIALDAAQGIEDRTRAAALLIGADYPTLEPIVRQWLDPRQPLDLQLAAVRLASSSDDGRVATLLLAAWPGYTPKVQEAVIDAIFNRQNRLPTLLEAIGDGTVGASALGTFHRVQLMENPDAAIRRRAQSLLGAGSSASGRDQVLAQYVAALKGPRDAKRGKLVYQEQCAKCHRLQGQGYEVGPDLATITSRADETLIADVLDPSRQLTVGYQHYTVITTDGRIFTGVLAAETATGISLRKEEGVEETILRKDVDEMAASSISMMPEELEKDVTPRDLVDLIAYLRKTLGPATPGVATLFDDQPAFAELLTEGSGTAAIELLDAFTGRASLAIAPPQRYASRIPGWQYPIRENPRPGEFRYFRFAWKSRGARGLMIELAADGQWPPAEEPLRRYYSGENTSGWKALELASDAPDDWVVVTRDLWKDFGPFTLTGIAPTAMGGEALFDRIELLRSIDLDP